MDTIEVSRLGRRASRVALGTWSMGGWMWGEHPDRTAAEATIETALDMGINVIDTAPVYGFGLSEEIVGDVLARRGDRDKVVIATKFGQSWNQTGQTRRDSSPARVREEVEGSLRRLKTDRIDLYQVHWPDPEVPCERTAEALAALRQEGKVLAAGVCNSSVQQMDAFRSAVQLTSCQLRYNLLERDVEAEQIPYAVEHALVFMAYSPLARGLLSGKWHPDEERADQARRAPMFHGEALRRNLEVVRRLDDLMRERHGRRVIHLAARWVLDRVPGSLVLWGARRPDQLDDVDDVWGWSLSKEDLADIDEILAF